MPQKPDQKLILRFRKFLYLIYLLALILPLCALYLVGSTANLNQYGWWLAPVLIVLMGVDQLVGKESAHPPGDRVKQEGEKNYYSILVFPGLPAATVLSVCGADFFSNTTELNWVGRIGWMVSLGWPISFLAFCAGHELIHRGHHANVVTPADTGSAKLNQSFYQFFPQAFKKAFVNARWLEKKRLNRRGNSVLSWRNELISWHLESLGIVIIYYFFFGLHGAIFFIGQGLIALALHLQANYIQHYGLRRRKLDDGRYEKFCAAHAWSCNFLLSNAGSFNFPHHADHHLNPRRPYQLLRHHKKSPQMPTGYFGMLFMSLIPPLWFKVINPRVLEYYKKEEFHKRIEGPFKREMPPSFSVTINQ